MVNITLGFKDKNPKSININLLERESEKILEEFYGSSEVGSVSTSSYYLGIGAIRFRRSNCLSKRLEDIILLWSDESKEWLGIKYTEFDNKSDVSGPFKLDNNHGKLIAEAYKSFAFDSPREVLHTPPGNLREGIPIKSSYDKNLYHEDDIDVCNSILKGRYSDLMEIRDKEGKILKDDKELQMAACFYIKDLKDIFSYFNSKNSKKKQETLDTLEGKLTDSRAIREYNTDNEGYFGVDYFVNASAAEALYELGYSNTFDEVWEKAKLEKGIVPEFKTKNNTEGYYKLPELIWDIKEGSLILVDRITKYRYYEFRNKFHSLVDRIGKEKEEGLITGEVNEFLVNLTKYNSDISYDQRDERRKMESVYEILQQIIYQPHYYNKNKFDIESSSELTSYRNDDDLYDEREDSFLKESFIFKSDDTPMIAVRKGFYLSRMENKTVEVEVLKK